MESINIQSYDQKRKNIKRLLDCAMLILGGVLFFFLPLSYFILISLLSPYFRSDVRKLSLFLCFIVAVSFYSSLKPFSDLAEYLNVYHKIESGEVNVFFYERFGYGIEFFSLMLMKTVGYLSNYNDQALLLTLYTLIFFMIYRVSIKISSVYYGAIFGSFFFSLLFLESASYFIRQNISVLFFLLAIINPTSKKRTYILFALSIFSHISGVINIFVYLFAKWYGHKINKPQRIIKVLMISLIGIIALMLFLTLTPIGRVLYEKSIYVINNHSYDALPLIYVILVTVNVFFIVTVSRRYSFDNIVIYYLFIKELFVFYMFLPFPAVPNRLGMILFSYSPVFLFQIYNNKVISFKRYLVGILFITLNIMPFLYSMSVISLKENKYSFYMNEPFTANMLQIVNYLYSNITNGVEYIDKGNLQ